MAERYGGVPRAELEDSDFVDPERRAFPVMTRQDVRDAVSSWGRYRGPLSFEEFKRRLIALAKRKGLDDALPAAWKEELAETKSGRRHSAADAAIIREMIAAHRAYAAKMSEHFRALGFADLDADGEITPAEAEAQLDAEAVKAWDLLTIAHRVEEAMLAALDELDLLEEPGDAGELAEAYRGVTAGYPDIKVYPGYAVVCLAPGVAWHAPYALEAGEVVVASATDWVRVEPTWTPIPDAAPLIGDAVKMVDDAAGLIQGYAVRFGSEAEPDLSEHRDYFAPDTDYWLNHWDRRPMLYHHAQDPATKAAPVIGAWVEAGMDEVGVWLKGQLDAAHRYHAAIKELIRRGLLRISTDSAPHLVVRQPTASGANKVVRWPIMAASLTPTPAEPRLLPVAYKSILPELGYRIDDHEAGAPDGRAGVDGAEATRDDALRRLALELDILELEG